MCGEIAPEIQENVSMQLMWQGREQHLLLEKDVYRVHILEISISNAVHRHEPLAIKNERNWLGLIDTSALLVRMCDMGEGGFLLLVSACRYGACM